VKREIVVTPDSPVKVLYCENNVDGTVGGSYYSLLYLVKNLDRRRYHPIVIFYTEHALVPAFREAGVDTQVWPKAQAFTFGGDHHRLWGRFHRICPIAVVLRKALNFLHEFLFPALERAWYLKRNGVKIVHLNNSVLYNHDWMFAAKLTGVKCLTHERGINDRYTSAAKYFGKRLNAVICISEAVRRNMCERGADFGNLETIHNGLDPNVTKIRILPDALRAAYGIDPDTVVIGMVGNIKAWKGQDTLIRAIDLVRDAFPSVRCLLVGDTAPSDREYEHALHKLIASFGLEKHVIFTGFQQNVADFLMMFDVVVHASVLPEPFGRVLLEAMACKKPVIGACAGAVPEIIEEGKTGLTFPPNDTERLAEAICELVGDPNLARKLGENGFHRLVNKFHITRNIETTECLYERILGATC
jgi:glycosyltransferase involved in cell wall biosynthesis